MSVILLIVLVTSLLGCDGVNTGGEGELSGSLKIIGSNTVTPLTSVWAEEFMKEAKYVAESRYEKYIVRKPHRIAGATQGDTGPIILCAPILMKGTDQFYEYAIISGEFVAGSGPNNNLRTKSDSTTIFYFLGTNPKDPSDLGAEVEFNIDGETHIIKESFTSFIPAGIQHGPLVIKNVTKPIFHYSSGSTERYT